MIRITFNFQALWLIAPRFFYHEWFFFKGALEAMGAFPVGA